MSAEVPAMTRLVFLDLHDARLGGFELGAEGSPRLTISTANAFFEIDIEQYAVWACAVRLVAIDMSRLELRGKGVTTGRVADGEFRGEHGARVEFIDVVRGRVATSLALATDDGGGLEVECSTLVVESVQPLHFLERWIGPLIEPG